MHEEAAPLPHIIEDSTIATAAIDSVVSHAVTVIHGILMCNAMKIVACRSLQGFET